MARGELFHEAGDIRSTRQTDKACYYVGKSFCNVTRGQQGNETKGSNHDEDEKKNKDEVSNTQRLSGCAQSGSAMSV